MFFLGSLLFNKKVGFSAALVLLITNIFVSESRYAEMESMLTFFITGSVYCFFKGYKYPESDKRWFVLFFGMMGLGTMTKGPFAFTFPLIPAISYLFIYNEQKLLIKKSFISGIKYFFIILLPWLLIILWLFPKFLLVVLGETAARYYTEGYGHLEPFYYYFETIGDTMFPWIFFLPFAIGIALSYRLTHWKKENVFLIIWIFGNLLFLSFSKAKRDFYLLPIAPAVALLIASTWDTIWIWAREQINCKGAYLQKVAFIIGGIIAVISFAIGDPFDLNFPGRQFPHIPSFLLFSGLLLLIVSGAKMILPRLSVARLSLFTIIALMLAVQCLYLTYTVPIKNMHSGKNFYIFVSHFLKPSEKVAYFGSYENYAFSFYAHRPIIYLKKRGAVQLYMDAREKRYLALTEKNLEDFSNVPWKAIFKSAYSEHLSRGSYVLFCNQ
jgi:4-amino-4-deoxy-L-arabinose transferase-like glycosyltransferase